MAGSADGLWESTFAANELLWGLAPSNAAERAAELLDQAGARTVLIPGIGYGRNAVPFLTRGMSVTGIEISRTAIGLSRSKLGLDLVIHEGSVEDMPYDDARCDAVFCHGLLYLLDSPAREKLIADCHRQLAPGGHMIFTVIGKGAPMYARGERLGEDWYETSPGVSMFFYDEASIERDLGAFGLIATADIEEPAAGRATFPFLFAVCRKS